MKNGNMLLGVFDSGVGGLTVVRALQDTLPQLDILYVGDTARVPYGNKSKEVVMRYSREICAYLAANGVDRIIAACNTASAFAVDELQHELSLPLTGVIQPGVATALAATRNGRIGIIGTQGTIRSLAYQNALLEQRQSLQLTALATPLLVPLIEENWLDHEATRVALCTYLQPLIEARVDTLVLACTHYPLLKPLLMELLGPEVQLVDSAAASAAAVARALGQQLTGSTNTNLGGGTLHVCLTDEPGNFTELARRFLARPPTLISRAVLETV